jgi:sugar phosphate isomerase/epimerase
MAQGSISRREWLAGSAGVGLAAAAGTAAEAGGAGAKEPFSYSLNTATIMGQNLPVVEQVEVAAKAGYQGFEPWVKDLDVYVKGGGDLKDLGKRIRDRGLVVPSAIGFPEWIVDDAARRKKGLEEARRAMDAVQRIGGTRIAAPPAGATDVAGMDLLKVAERFGALQDVGAKIGVAPQAEVWGFSKPLRRVGEAMLLVLESGRPGGCVLADVYHLHKGGSGFGWLGPLGPAALGVFHVNDYPADPPRETITDAHRVFPGDGVAPLPQLLRDLRATGWRGMLSLELFNRDYWKQDALQVARTGLEKTRAVVRRSLEG